jgi:hypothetical protein
VVDKFLGVLILLDFLTETAQFGNLMLPLLWLPQQRAYQAFLIRPRKAFGLQD